MHDEISAVLENHSYAPVQPASIMAAGGHTLYAVTPYGKLEGTGKEPITDE